MQKLKDKLNKSDAELTSKISIKDNIIQNRDS